MIISPKNYPELHKAIKALRPDLESYVIDKHFYTWLPKTERNLRELRTQNQKAWQEFVHGDNLNLILHIRNSNGRLLGGTHQILEWFADR